MVHLLKESFLGSVSLGLHPFVCHFGLISTLSLHLPHLIVLEEVVNAAHLKVVIAHGPNHPVELLPQLKKLSSDD